MLWVKFGSIFIVILIVIIATLGGREFFEYFDVSIHKKNEATSQSTPISDGVENENNNKSNYSSQNVDEKKIDKDWEDFN